MQQKACPASNGSTMGIGGSNTDLQVPIGEKQCQDIDYTSAVSDPSSHFPLYALDFLKRVPYHQLKNLLHFVLLSSFISFLCITQIPSSFKISRQRPYHSLIIRDRPPPAYRPQSYPDGADAA